MAACAGNVSAAAASPAFDRLAAQIVDPRGYAMRVDSHEEFGDRSEDLSYHFASPPREPGGVARPEIAIEQGRGAGATLSYLGDDRVALREKNGYMRETVDASDPIATTLRGSSVLAAGLDAFVACANAHRASVSERRGPSVDGRPTIAIVLDRNHVACPHDAPADTSLTLDIVYVSVPGEMPMLRKRYAGREIVMRWRIRDFTTGPRRPLSARPE